MHNFTITMDQKNTKKSAEEILCQNAYCSMQQLCVTAINNANIKKISSPATK